MHEFIRKAYKKKLGMGFIVCTGTPDYKIPEDLKKLPSVFSELFKKPVTDIKVLEKALLQLIETINT